MRRKTGLERELKVLLLYVCPYLKGPQVVEGIPTPTRHSSQARDSTLFQAFSAPTVSWSLIPKQDLWADHLCVLAWSQRKRYSIFENLGSQDFLSHQTSPEGSRAKLRSVPWLGDGKPGSGCRMYLV